MSKGSGTRSGLLWEVERLLNETEHLPEVLLLENVPQVHGAQFGADFDNWKRCLEDLGYTNFWQDLNAKNYGVAQNRNRTFMVSILQQGIRYEFPKPFKLEKTMKDYLEEKVDKKYYIENEKSKELIDKLIENGTLADRQTDRQTDRQIKACLDLEVGGQRGIVYQTDGIQACQSATQYKDPMKILDADNR